MKCLMIVIRLTETTYSEYNSIKDAVHAKLRN